MAMRGRKALQQLLQATCEAARHSRSAAPSFAAASAHYASHMQAAGASGVALQQARRLLSGLSRAGPAGRPSADAAFKRIATEVCATCDGHGVAFHAWTVAER